MALFIPASLHRPISRVSLPRTGFLTLENLYRLCARGHIELVPTGDGRLLLCEPGARLAGKPRNRRASELVVFPSRRDLSELRAYHLQRGHVLPCYEDTETDQADLTCPIDVLIGDCLLCESWEIQ